MMTNNEMMHEIRSWVIAFAELTASMRTDSTKLMYQSKMQAAAQIAESCGMISHEDALAIHIRGEKFDRMEIYDMFQRSENA